MQQEADEKVETTFARKEYIIAYVYGIAGGVLWPIVHPLSEVFCLISHFSRSMVPTSRHLVRHAVSSASRKNWQHIPTLCAMPYGYLADRTVSVLLATSLATKIL